MLRAADGATMRDKRLLSVQVNRGLAARGKVGGDAESAPNPARGCGSQRGAAPVASRETRAHRRHAGACRRVDRPRRPRILRPHIDRRRSRGRHFEDNDAHRATRDGASPPGRATRQLRPSTAVAEATLAAVRPTRHPTDNHHDRAGPNRVGRIVNHQVAAAPAPTYATARWRALGTTALLLAPAEQMTAARRAVEVELEAIDSAASRFRPDSELSRLNRAAGSWTAVSPLLLQALTLGIRAAALTGGAVDPTLGGELRELGYDRDFEQLAHLPATRPLQPAVDQDRRGRRSRWAKIELGEDPPSARLPPGAQIDLGATAKALAADRAAAAAHTATGAGVLVSLGGDISTAGDCPAGGWPIHVSDDHRSDPSADGQTITIRDGGLATSSLVMRRWEHEGRAPPPHPRS